MSALLATLLTGTLGIAEPPVGDRTERVAPKAAAVIRRLNLDDHADEDDEMLEIFLEAADDGENADQATRGRHNDHADDDHADDHERDGGTGRGGVEVEIAIETHGIGSGQVRRLQRAVAEAVERALATFEDRFAVELRVATDDADEHEEREHEEREHEERERDEQEHFERELHRMERESEMLRMRRQMQEMEQQAQRSAIETHRHQATTKPEVVAAEVIGSIGETFEPAEALELLDAVVGRTGDRQLKLLALRQKLELARRTDRRDLARETVLEILDLVAGKASRKDGITDEIDEALPEATEEAERPEDAGEGPGLSATTLAPISAVNLSVPTLEFGRWQWVPATPSPKAPKFDINSSVRIRTTETPFFEYDDAGNLIRTHLKGTF